MIQVSCASFKTPWGVGMVAASPLGVCRVWLPGDSTMPLSQLSLSASRDLADTAAEQLQRYFHKRLQLFDLPVDLTGLTSFRTTVLQQTALIPYGTLLTYGQLAQQVGNPRAARAVGGALAANPIAVIIPCHRVVASNGALTGYTAPGGVMMKKFLLSLEEADFNTVIF